MKNLFLFVLTGICVACVTRHVISTRAFKVLPQNHPQTSAPKLQKEMGQYWLKALYCSAFTNKNIKITKIRL